MMKTKPGVMIYFDLMESLKHMSDKNAGLLFKGILHYAREGAVPKLSPTLLPLWGMIQGRLDNDDRAYREKTRKNQYNAYVRWQKQQELEPLPYEIWSLQNPPEEF